MSTENSDVAHSLDEEIIATNQHDQVSNDHSQEEDLLGKSLSHVGRVFMANSLTPSPRTNSRKYSDDETGPDSINPESSDTDTFSAEIGAHLDGLSAEQRLRGIVENANTLEDICKRLNFSLPLAQLTNALQWKKNLVKFYPMIKGWTIQSEIPTFGKMLYIQGLKNVNDMKVDELEEKLDLAEDKLTAKLTKLHNRWTQIPSQDHAMKLVSISAALAWLGSQCMYDEGTILSSAADCTMHRGSEVEKLPTESPEALKCPIGVTYDDGKRNQHNEMKVTIRVEIINTLCLTIRISVLQYWRNQENIHYPV